MIRVVLVVAAAAAVVLVGACSGGGGEGLVGGPDDPGTAEDGSAQDAAGDAGARHDGTSGDDAASQHDASHLPADGGAADVHADGARADAAIDADIADATSADSGSDAHDAAPDAAPDATSDAAADAGIDAATDASTEGWIIMTTAGAPSARAGHTAVWTGREMIVWGGTNFDATGGRYDPASDRWTATSTAGAPSGRDGHVAVWTGAEMIVWGGGDNRSVHVYGDGARYDPATDTWKPVSAVGAPSPRDGAVAVWTGREMIVWGGLTSTRGSPGTGARYDPATDTWSPMTTADAPAQRVGESVVWTGTQMIVWGGSDGDDPNNPGTPYKFPDGGLYDPSTDTWIHPPVYAGQASFFVQSAVWTGDRMLLYGGLGDDNFMVSSYDPAKLAFELVTNAHAPETRWAHTAVWTGTEMIAWGGIDLSNQKGHSLPNGGAWNKATGWRLPPLLTIDGTKGRASHSAVWTGREMIVWGGYDTVDGQSWNTGARYHR